MSVLAGNRIADLFSGEAPDLVWQQDTAYWRVPVVLSSRSLGRIGVVGSIDVNVETGELQVTDQLPEERANFQISGAGRGIHWPDLDEDIGVEGLLLGLKSSESPASFQRWLAYRQGKEGI